jgi:hypothetical protein
VFQGEKKKAFFPPNPPALQTFHTGLLLYKYMPGKKNYPKAGFLLAFS